MPLTSLQANVVVQWALSRSNAPFADTKSGTDGVEYNLSDLAAAFNQVYAASLSIGTGATTLDLQSLQNLVFESFSLTAVLFVFVLPAGEGVNVGPGAANGLELFGGGGRSVDVPKNGCLFWGGDPAGAGLTVDGTHKTLAIENLGAGTATVEVVIAGAA
jgi:hypothetical protein